MKCQEQIAMEASEYFDREVNGMIRPEDLTAETPLREVVEILQFGPVGPWPQGWSGWKNVIDAHRELVQHAALKNWKYPDKFNGRGIVSCVSAKPGWSSGKELANGYFPGAWVMVKEIRRLGCTLPITFCHLGHLEWDPTLTKLMEPLGVSVIDLREWEKKNQWRILAGWESKCAAVLASAYGEVLFLDADNVPVRDPSYLFDEPAYQQRGAIFWPDLPPQDRAEWVPEVVWNNVGLNNSVTKALESGQLLIDKKRCWAELNVCKSINEHSDYWFSQVFGDKDTFLLSWHKVASVQNREPAYYLMSTAAGWNGAAIVQHGSDGLPLFEHCVRNKPTILTYPHGRACLSHANECHDHLFELRSLWNGKLWHNEAPMNGDYFLFGKLIGKTFLYRRVGLGERPMRFLEDNRIGKGAARCEFSWSIIDGKLAVTDVDGKLTFLASEAPDGTLRGRWEEFEKADVELIPVG